MKLFIGSITIFILFLFGAKVKLIDSTSQQWMGGRYETGRGTDYILTLKARGDSEKLIIKELWLGDKMYEVSAVKNLAKRSDNSFKRKDIIFVHAGEKIKPDENGNMVNVSGQKLEPPRGFNGKALLVYNWKGKDRFLEIEDFRKLEKIIYP